VRLAALLVLVAAPVSAQDADWTFPLVVHVASEAGVSVMSDDAIRAAVDDATSAFAAAGVAFALQAIMPTDAPAGRLRSEVETGAIHVFVVARILDPHPSETTRRAAGWVGREPTGRISGAHIPADGMVPGTYIVASALGVSSMRTLAHELGHVFGLSHSADATILMSYGSERLGFDDDQIAAVRRRARRLARSRDWVTDPDGV
jgi:hypothetical protein